MYAKVVIAQNESTLDLKNHLKSETECTSGPTKWTLAEQKELF